MAFDKDLLLHEIPLCCSTKLEGGHWLHVAPRFHSTFGIPLDFHPDQKLPYPVLYEL